MTDTMEITSITQLLLADTAALNIINLDVAELRRWLEGFAEELDGWTPTPVQVAELVDLLDDALTDRDEAALAGWRSTRFLSVFSHMLDGDEVLVGAEVAGGGRIVSYPQNSTQLADSLHRCGVDAAIEALAHVAFVISQAYPHEVL